MTLTDWSIAVLFALLALGVLQVAGGRENAAEGILRPRFSPDRG